MRRLILAALALLCPTASAEEYQCKNASGCSAEIAVDGEMETTNFRKGDIVSTEAGWFVSTDDGWEKIRTKPVHHAAYFGYVVRGGAVYSLGIVRRIPSVKGSYAVPLEVALL